jgi:hypothetical protein
MDLGLSAGILAAGPEQQAYSLSGVDEARQDFFFPIPNHCLILSMMLM